jgi:DNA-binding response OmpR family regulator
VIEAESGEEALALIDKIAPTLVLLDLRLPRMDGFDVLRRLEASGQTVQVILVTSVEDELDQLVGYKLGALDYVVKPVSPKVRRPACRESPPQARGGRRSTPRTSFSLNHCCQSAGTSRVSGTVAGDSPAWTREHMLIEYGIAESRSAGSTGRFSSPLKT